MIADDIEDMIADECGPACECSMAIQGQNAPLPIRMICRATYGNSLDPRNKLLAWLDESGMPRGSDWGYGLALAADLPQDVMSDSVQGEITDAAGNVWRIEAALPIMEIGGAQIAAWRFALTGTHRGMRR